MDSVYWCVFVGTSCKRRPPDFCYFEDIDWLIHSLSRFVKGTRPYMFPVLYALDDIGSGSHVHLSLCQS
ncbi:unnamed protein product [Camellia sinensis]